jgi:hypothetical protein
MKRALFWICALAIAACATESFQPRFQAPSQPTQPLVLSELLKPRARHERPVVVGLTPDPMRLFAWDAQQSELLWEREVQATSAPLVAADAVVLQEHDSVVVRDLHSGAERARISDGGALVGADGEGSTLVLTLAYADDKAQPGGVMVIDRDSVRWKQRLGLPVGVAAIAGDYVSVPWATQRLSILRASDGLELSRSYFKQDVLGHVLVDSGVIYIGQLGLLPLTRELFEQPDRKHAPYTPAKRTLPAQPAWLSDGYAPVPDPDNAQYRLQLTWRMALGDSAVRSENDLLLLRFYRLLFGLEAGSDQVRWVRSFDHDLVAAAMQPGSALIVDSEGIVRALDPQGNTRTRVALGRQVRVASIRLGSWLPPVKPQFASEPPLEPIEGTLNQQLMAAASLADDRLGAARAYAATLLARSDEPEVTAQLIGLCGERKSSELLRAAACNELAARTRGDAAVLGALRVRASFLEGTEAPPVGPLAQAAAKMRLAQAGPLLVSHIEDPNTSLRDLVAVFAAVQTLQERSAAASVERFVRLHHAEPDGSELVPAVHAALQTMALLRLPAQRATLQDVASDALTPKTTRDAAQAALSALDAPPPSPPTDAPPPEKPRPSDDVQTDPRAYALGADVVRKALAPVRERLTRCVASDASHPHVGRANLVVDAAGSVEGVFVLPASLQACAEPLLRATKFPSTRLGRQHITHIFSGPPEKPEPKPTEHR